MGIGQKIYPHHKARGAETGSRVRFGDEKRGSTPRPRPVWMSCLVYIAFQFNFTIFVTCSHHLHQTLSFIVCESIVEKHISLPTVNRLTFILKSYWILFMKLNSVYCLFGICSIMLAIVIKWSLGH